MNTQRNIVVHYHLFKNAGTSVDHLLRKNFSDKWHSFDGNSAGDIINTKELEGVIAAKAEMLAFSSHQIIPPLPVGDFTVYPIVFLRDPIDRIKSAYLFEWKKQLVIVSSRKIFFYNTEKEKNDATPSMIIDIRYAPIFFSIIYRRVRLLK